jgi:RNA polymerase sigma factor (sigma-70 family)
LLDLARRLAADGVARHGDLGLSLADLAAWIGLARAPAILSSGPEGRVSKDDRAHPDLYLAAALAKGVPEAWGLWRDSLELPLVRWLTRLAGGARLGEELVAELAGDLFAGKLREYRGDSALRTWLTVVARNRLTDRLRSEGRRGVSLSLWAGGEPRSESVVPEVDVADEVIGRHDGERLARDLRDELEKLDAEERRLLVRYFLHGARMRVLARDYGVNRTQVGRRLKALCARVRAALVARGALLADAETPPAVTVEVLKSVAFNCPGYRPEVLVAPGRRRAARVAGEAVREPRAA